VSHAQKHQNEDTRSQAEADLVEQAVPKVTEEKIETWEIDKEVPEVEDACK
jgi:hypothetical protein